jgi:uncharacterized protein (DUF1501 family)
MTDPSGHSRTSPTRRGVIGLCASVSLFGFRAFAAPLRSGRKLVVIIARGGMDGLSLAPPVGDPNYAVFRGAVAIPADQALKVDGTFGLHPKLETLHSLMMAGEARIAPAVALPDHLRSHFEAQDLLETGGARIYAASTGWLNRALQALGTAPAANALAIGAQQPLILRGPIQAQSWSPGSSPSAEAERIAAMLQDLYAGDHLLGPALAAGLRTEAMAASLGMGQIPGSGSPHDLASAAVKFMLADGGPSIAVMSLDGFDTHAGQGAVEGQLAARFGGLDQALQGLHDGLGDEWRSTLVLVATEFGRTAKVNGTGGTDHGTASAMVLAGGALKSGGLIGDWPTLDEGRLLEARDLMPTLDIRSVFKGVLRDHLGVDRRAVEELVFPQSAGAPALPGLTVA